VCSLIAAPIVDHEFFKEDIYGINFTLYYISTSAVYVGFSLLGVYLAKKELGKGKNFSTMLICVLCLFMTVNAILNLLMANYEMYYALACFKKGLNCDSVTFHDAYKAVEILIALIVGGHGLNYIAQLDICRYGYSRGNIKANRLINKSKL